MIAANVIWVLVVLDIDDYWIKHNQLNTRDSHCVLREQLSQTSGSHRDSGWSSNAWRTGFDGLHPRGRTWTTAPIAGCRTTPHEPE
jgi:hypothetical protein